MASSLDPGPTDRGPNHTAPEHRRVGHDDPADKLAVSDDAAVADGPDPPAALTAAMAAGDPAAVAAFYRRYFPRLYGWARRFSRRDESFCLDVVQDAVLRIVRTVRRVDAEPQLLAWLRLVVQTTAYDLLKAERRRERRQAAAAVTVPPGDEAAAVLSGAAADGDDAVADDEQLAWLRAELDAMDPRLAEMLDLRFRRGWTMARIGGLFGLPAGTIDGRLRRALAVLRKRAVEAFDDER